MSLSFQYRLCCLLPPHLLLRSAQYCLIQLRLNCLLCHRHFIGNEVVSPRGVVRAIVPSNTCVFLHGHTDLLIVIHGAWKMAASQRKHWRRSGRSSEEAGKAMEEVSNCIAQEILGLQRRNGKHVQLQIKCVTFGARRNVVYERMQQPGRSTALDVAVQVTKKEGKGGASNCIVLIISRHQRRNCGEFCDRGSEVAGFVLWLSYVIWQGIQQGRLCVARCTVKFTRSQRCRTVK